MAADQQFCLRWNNHQSTLISVFDSLLENGTLVDCTLAAEGQYLKAHKVVLSACSPYLETLLSQHYEKHPIVILKDVKFTELKSMMDYMYRGEVNISQDQLGTFLKAAESLQIKGLSDNGDEGAASTVPNAKRQDPAPASRTPVTPATRTLESKRPAPLNDLSDAREGSISPTSRKRRRRRPSQGEESDNHLDNNCDLPPAQSTPLPVPSTTIVPSPVTNLPKQIKQEPRLENSIAPESGLLKEKIEPPSEPLLEPKTEYLDYQNDNSIEVEDLTLDDDEDLDSSMDASRPGPSQGDMSSQGYPPWNMGDQSGTDEIFMAAQEAVGAATAQRDSQDCNIRVESVMTIAQEDSSSQPAFESAYCTESTAPDFFLSEYNEIFTEDEEPHPSNVLQVCLGKETEIYERSPSEEVICNSDQNHDDENKTVLPGYVRDVLLEEMGLKKKRGRLFSNIRGNNQNRNGPARLNLKGRIILKEDQPETKSQRGRRSKVFKGYKVLNKPTTTVEPINHYKRPYTQRSRGGGKSSFISNKNELNVTTLRSNEMSSGLNTRAGKPVVKITKLTQKQVRNTKSRNTIKSNISTEKQRNPTPKKRSKTDWYTDLKNFKCDKCGNKYMYFKGLRQHQRFECNKEPRFYCPFCPTSPFRYPHIVRDHIHMQHPAVYKNWYNKHYIGLFSDSKRLGKLQKYIE